MMRLSVCVFFWLSAAVPLSAQLGSVLLPMRDWTSTEGRTIRAEVLGFEGDSVQFRLEGGQRAPVPELRLSPPDRAELVRLRFREQCWIQAGEAANTNYYHSHLTPEDKTHSGIVVPFSEIDAAVRGGLLQRRLSEFAGNRPPEDSSGTIYYPKDWTEHRRKTRQGLVFGTEKDSGRPMLVIQGLSNRFQGGRITELAIRGDLARGYITVSVGAAANQIERKDGNVWTYATVRVDREQAGELAKLAGGKALDIRITSGEDSSTFPLANGHLETSLEALRCYQWATLVP